MHTINNNHYSPQLPNFYDDKELTKYTQEIKNHEIIKITNLVNEKCNTKLKTIETIKDKIKAYLTNEYTKVTTERNLLTNILRSTYTEEFNQFMIKLKKGNQPISKPF